MVNNIYWKFGNGADVSYIAVLSHSTSEENTSDAHGKNNKYKINLFGED
jgi:hypothetical protein